MKLFVFTFVALLATAWSEQRLAQATPQEKRELNFAATDKQAYATASTPPATAAPSLYKVSPQTFSTPKASAAAIPTAQALSYSPQTISYTPQTVSYVPQTAFKYAPAPASIPAHVTYGFAPQPQQQFEYASQPVAYAQPVAKLAPAPAATKYFAAPAPAPATVHFSPASEVSSFKFSSPLVTYSNLGVLTQVTGKLANEAVQSQATQVAATPQLSYSAAPQKVAAAPVQAPQQVTYSAAPQYAFASAAPQKVAYAATVPQEFAFASAPQQVAYAAAPQRVVYATQAAASAVPAAKVIYTAAPAPPAKVLYAAAPAKQVAYTPQQLTYSESVPQQLAYAIAAPQGAHSSPEPVYVAAPQVQYANSAEIYTQ